MNKRIKTHSKSNLVHHWLNIATTIAPNGRSFNRNSNHHVKILASFVPTCKEIRVYFLCTIRKCYSLVVEKSYSLAPTAKLFSKLLSKRKHLQQFALKLEFALNIVVSSLLELLRSSRDTELSATANQRGVTYVLAVQNIACFRFSNALHPWPDVLMVSTKEEQ